MSSTTIETVRVSPQARREPFIHLAGVTKVYRSGRKEHLAISDATFDV